MPLQNWSSVWAFACSTARRAAFQLTDAGKTFVERVGPAMTDIHDAMLAAQSQQETPMGTLRISAFASAAREVMAPLIPTFLRRYPHGAYRSGHGRAAGRHRRRGI